MAIFRAFGTEPFWNVNVEGDSLTLPTPEDHAGVLMQANGVRSPMAWRSPAAMTARR